jgi:hypothetical protein
MVAVICDQHVLWLQHAWIVALAFVSNAYACFFVHLPWELWAEYVKSIWGMHLNLFEGKKLFTCHSLTARMKGTHIATCYVIWVRADLLLKHWITMIHLTLYLLPCSSFPWQFLYGKLGSLFTLLRYVCNDQLMPPFHSLIFTIDRDTNVILRFLFHINIFVFFHLISA